MKKLEKFLKENDLTEDIAIDMLAGMVSDPAKDLYATIVIASRHVTRKIQDQTLNFDDPFQKGLFQLLQMGDKATKTLRSAYLDAYPEKTGATPGGSESGDEEDVPLADRKRK